MNVFSWLKQIRRHRKRKQCLPLPVCTLPYNQRAKRRRKRFLFPLLVLLLLSTFYTIYSTKWRIAREELLHVWVVNQDLIAPTEIELSHLKTHYFPRKNLPTSVFLKSEDIVGKVLIRDVVANEILLPHYFTQEVDVNSISTKFQKSFALTMDENWFEAKFPTLASHDTIDILTTNPKASFSQTIPVAQNISVIEIQYGEKNDKKTLVVNLTQDEARAVLFARGARLPMHIIVHSSLSPENESD